MRTIFLYLATFCFAATAQAGFKVKLIKPKKPEKFQVHTTVTGVTYAADLLLRGKEQEKFFHKKLLPSDIIAIRLAVFNNGSSNVMLPLDRLQLLGPDGSPLARIAPKTVAQAVLRGLVVSASPRQQGPVSVTPTIVGPDPTDPNDPRYNPTLDPTDPRYDPNDPRNPRNRRYGGPVYRPGVDVVLNPGTGGGADLSEFERQLVTKDFHDKVHAPEPILKSMKRDKFLYFSLRNAPSSARGFTLRLPPSKGIPQEIVLKF